MLTRLLRLIATSEGIATTSGMAKTLQVGDGLVARMIQDAKLDSGYPRQGPMAAPGVYTARLTVGERSLDTRITVRPDPRLQVSQADLESQLKLSLEVRDDITRLTELVESLRSIRRQLRDRIDLLKDKPEAAALVKGSTALIAKLDALENQIHNPTAEVSYDILAMKGGTRLYSRLAPLMDWIASGSGAPTAGMRQVFAEQDKELGGYAGQWDSLVSVDLAGLAKEASRLGIGFVVVK